MNVIRILVFTVSLFTSLALAQRPSAYGPGQYEFGVAAGYSFYNSQTITNSRTNSSVSAGLAGGSDGAFWVGHNMYNRVSGELRYDFGWNSLKLSSGGTKVNFGAQSHAVHYDFLLYTKGGRAKVRPYLVGGAGIKVFDGRGTERSFQPLGDVAVLTRTRDLRPLASFGGGVRIQSNQRTTLRIEVRDHLTPFPDQVITPITEGSAPSWLHNFVVLFGASWAF